MDTNTSPCYITTTTITVTQPLSSPEALQYITNPVCVAYLLGKSSEWECFEDGPAIGDASRQTSSQANIKRIDRCLVDHACRLHLSLAVWDQHLPPQQTVSGAGRCCPPEGGHDCSVAGVQKTALRGIRSSPAALFSLANAVDASDQMMGR